MTSHFFWWDIALPFLFIRHISLVFSSGSSDCYAFNHKRKKIKGQSTIKLTKNCSLQWNSISAFSYLQQKNVFMCNVGPSQCKPLGFKLLCQFDSIQFGMLVTSYSIDEIDRNYNFFIYIFLYMFDFMCLLPHVRLKGNSKFCIINEKLLSGNKRFSCNTKNQIVN